MSFKKTLAATAVAGIAVLGLQSAHAFWGFGNGLGDGYGDVGFGFHASGRAHGNGYGYGHPYYGYAPYYGVPYYGAPVTPYGLSEEQRDEIAKQQATIRDQIAAQQKALAEQHRQAVEAQRKAFEDGNVAASFAYAPGAPTREPFAPVMDSELFTSPAEMMREANEIHRNAMQEMREIEREAVERHKAMREEMESRRMMRFAPEV